MDGHTKGIAGCICSPPLPRVVYSCGPGHPWKLQTTGMIPCSTSSSRSGSTAWIWHCRFFCREIMPALAAGEGLWPSAGSFLEGGSQVTVVEQMISAGHQEIQFGELIHHTFQHITDHKASSKGSSLRPMAEFTNNNGAYLWAMASWPGSPLFT